MHYQRVSSQILQRLYPHRIWTCTNCIINKISLQPYFGDTPRIAAFSCSYRVKFRFSHPYMIAIILNVFIFAQMTVLFLYPLTFLLLGETTLPNVDESLSMI